MVDSMRLNRTDTALVRVVVPVIDRDKDTATRTGVGRRGAQVELHCLVEQIPHSAVFI
jgi:hypothetical protein